MSTMTHDTIETKPLDPTKPVQQRNGRPARLCQRQSDESLGNGCTVVVEYQMVGGVWTVGMRYADGRLLIDEDSQYDIINVPEAPRTRKVWRNTYPNDVYAYDSLDEAETCASPGRIGPAIPVEVPCEAPKPATKTMQAFLVLHADSTIGRWGTREEAIRQAAIAGSEYREITWEVPV